MNYKYSVYVKSRMVMSILSISVLLLSLVIIHLFEFNSAKATDLSSNRNSNLGYSNVTMMLNGTLQTLSSNNTNSNSSSTASCFGLKSFNVSRPLPCQEETSKAPPIELSSGNVSLGFTTSAALIAKDLTALSPSEIKEYGITDLSTDDLRIALNLLDKENLGKVLSNIPPEDLATIRKKIGPSTFDPILEKLSENDRVNINKKFP